MKTVRIHTVNLPVFWLSRRGRAENYSQKIAERSNPFQPASSLDSDPILPVAIVCDDIRNRTPN